MIKTAETYNTALSTPLGRAIWAKYLISSKYIHRIQNAVFSEEQLVSLREAALLLTWTRARIHDDSNSIRTHIANNRVSQPPLSVVLAYQTHVYKYTPSGSLGPVNSPIWTADLCGYNYLRLN